MLYRTYRPSTWDEVIGQEHVVRTLKGALSSDRVGHAYLLCGPRGTGKTTLARIFAKAINCSAKKRPCGSCDFCVAVDEGRSLDLIEIDAASNRTIDDMRALKEAAGVSAVGGGYKVYLIDEAHMLTKEACNAFLKLLEEPPAKTVFILATTDPQKMIPTVLSRVQRFDFKKLTQKEIAAKLERILVSEKLTAEPEVVAAIAAASDGALRDAEVMLTKLASHAGKELITGAAVQTVLGLVPTSWHADFVDIIAAGDRAAALRFLHRVGEQGIDADQFAKGLLEYLRQVMVAKIDPTIIAQAGLAMADTQRQRLDHFAAVLDGKLLVAAIQAFTRARTEIRAAAVPLLPLELAVLAILQ